MFALCCVGKCDQLDPGDLIPDRLGTFNVPRVCERAQTSMGPVSNRIRAGHLRVQHVQLSYFAAKFNQS